MNNIESIESIVHKSYEDVLGVKPSKTLSLTAGKSIRIRFNLLLPRVHVEMDKSELENHNKVAQATLYWAYLAQNVNPITRKRNELTKAMLEVIVALRATHTIFGVDRMMETLLLWFCSIETSEISYLQRISTEKNKIGGLKRTQLGTLMVIKSLSENENLLNNIEKLSQVTSIRDVKLELFSDDNVAVQFRKLKSQFDMNGSHHPPLPQARLNRKE